MLQCLKRLRSCCCGTAGVTFFQELNEWGRQCRRWIVGSSESFHYFIIHYRHIIMHSDPPFGAVHTSIDGSTASHVHEPTVCCAGRIPPHRAVWRCRFRPFFSGIWWFFVFFAYYAVLLCSAAVFTTLASIPFPWVAFPTPTVTLFGETFVLNFAYVTAVGLGLQYLAFAGAFVIDAVACRQLGIVERIHPLRNLLHFISAPVVLLVYSLVAFISIVRFVFEGKAMAKHDMAAKEGFTVH